MAKKQIKIIKSTPSPDGDLYAGKVVELDEKLANKLIKGKFAEEIGETVVNLAPCTSSVKTISQMNKTELLEYAKANGITANDTMTKAEIIDVISKNSNPQTKPLNEMTKEELLAYAKENKIEVKDSMTVDEIIAVIEA